jgi:hypothetical protein
MSGVAGTFGVRDPRVSWAAGRNVTADTHNPTKTATTPRFIASSLTCVVVSLARRGEYVFILL